MYNCRNIKNNQTVGYSQERIINGTAYLYEYAIKKQNNVFNAYFFCVEKKYIDTIEDYATEEILNFSSIDDALIYLKSKGASEYLLKPMKGLSIL